jgi:hypothetical protein
VPTDDPGGTVALAYLLAGAGLAGFACLALMYGLEMDSVGAHVFGPLSDLGTPVWNLLLVPLLLTFYPLLKVTLFGRALTAITVVLAVAGAGSSALLVTKTLTFAISTPITVLGVLVQGLWLFTLTMRLRAVPGWPRWVLRLGLFIPVAQAIGAAFVGISLGFGWGSVPQVAIMAIGLVAGVPAWAAWPVWFLLSGGSLPGRTTARLRTCWTIRRAFGHCAMSWHLLSAPKSSSWA